MLNIHSMYSRFTTNLQYHYDMSSLVADRFKQRADYLATSS